MRTIFLGLIFCVGVWLVQAAEPQPNGSPRKLELKGGQFVIDGEPLYIRGGEMHLPRVLHPFWEDRIKKAKAMGLNAVSLYVMWNEIESEEGQFSFTGQNDVRRFVKLCEANGLWVILRPGPYVCAEYEFGGFPYWLINKKCDLRKANPTKLACDKRYIMEIAKQVADLQIQKGGPILMVQVENEHRAIDEYMVELTKIYREAGFDGQLFTCDPGLKTFEPETGIPGVLRGVNGVVNDQKLYERVKFLSDKEGFPVYSAEVYTAWYSHWGMKINRRPVSSELNNAKWLADRNISFSYYVFHGGTTFGFKTMDVAITSYDYDAPVDEAGRIKPKYLALRDFFTERFKLSLPPVPPDPDMITIPSFKLERACSMLDILPKPLLSERAKSMEELNQGYGFILYRKTFENGVSGKFDFYKARDYAVLMVNGVTITQSCMKYGRESLCIALNEPGKCTLDILVHNLGRTRATPDERKGFIDEPTLDGKKVTGWEIFSLPLDPLPPLPGKASHEKTPSFYQGTFIVDKVGETFLDMRNFGFGAVWVNGHNLGRYWDVGAARSLYLPSVWMKKGVNEVVVLDLKQTGKTPTLQGTTDLIEEAPVPFPEDLKAKK